MKILTVVSLSLILAGPLSAQNWTAEERGVIDQIETCWDAWIEAQEAGGPDLFFERCPYDERASMWWTDFGAPQTPEGVLREWDFSSAVDLDWVDLRPIAVRIWGDVAMVQLYGIWKANTSDGPVTTEFKRTELFQNRDGQWVFVGGQGTPASAKDADPYN